MEIKMEILNELLTKLGLDLELLITLSFAVLLIVNAIKDKISDWVEVKGKGTHILTIVVAFGLSIAVYSQSVDGINWIAVSITTFICWMGPDSLNTYINRKASKIKKE